MKEKVTKYYLPVFAFVFPFSTVSFLSAYFGNNNIDDVFYLAIVFIVLNIALTLIFGTLYWKFGANWKAKFKRRILKKKELQKFLEIGFKANEEFLHGKIDDYLIFIQPEMDALGQRKWIEIKILFNPKIQNQYIPEYVFNKLQQTHIKQLRFSRNSVVLEKDFALLLPIKFNKLMQKIKAIIEILKGNNITSISMKEFIENEPELLKHNQQVTRFFNITR